MQPNLKALSKMNLKDLCLVLAAAALATNVHAQTVDTVIATNLFEPHSVAVDSQNDLYISDGANNRVVKYVPTTGELKSIAGLAGQSGAANGIGILARFSQPQGLVLARGGLVVADSANHLIRFVSFSGSVSNLAGNAGIPGLVDGPSQTAEFRYPIGLAVDENDNIYIADSKNNAIRKLDQNNNVTTIATGFYEPAAIAIGDGGILWVADTRHHVIQKVETNGQASIIAGSLGESGDLDSLSASAALLNSPRGLLWLGSATGLLISDSGNQTIRRLYFNPTLNTYSLETLAGTPGQSGLIDGAAGQARFNSPLGLARDSLNGGFLVVDRANNAIRRIQTSAPLPPVSNPRIGIVEFRLDDFGVLRSVLIPVTQSVFNNEQIIAVLDETGTATYITYGATPPSVLEDTIPSPSPKTGLTPPDYRDGLLPDEVPATLARPQPDLTVKAIGTQDGRRSSQVVQARFRFKTANPQIVGDNAAAFLLKNTTIGAQMFYTVDGSVPTSDRSVNPASIGPVSDGAKVSLLITNEITFKARAFKPDFKSSDITTKVFSPTNFVANKISFGFEGGEASSEFIAAAGQTFLAPVTLTLLPDQKIYSLQFNVTVTNRTGLPVQPGAFSFISMLQKPIPGTTPVVYEPIPPAMFEGSALTNLVVTNSSANLLGVGWLERFTKLDLYDSRIQDLVTYLAGTRRSVSQPRRESDLGCLCLHGSD